MRNPRQDILRSIDALSRPRISRKQKKWLKGLRGALAIPLSGATMAEVRMGKADWNYNLMVFRHPDLARWRFRRTT